MLIRREEIEVKLQFKKEEIKRLLERYYKEKEDFIGKVSMRCLLENVGYGMLEREEAVVEIKLTGSLNIFGEKVVLDRSLTKEEVQDVFSAMLYDAGYEISGISYDMGVCNTILGYGCQEHSVNKPYFNGLVATVKNKKLVK